MSAKEIKSHLKKAKAAIDKQDFQKAKECCKDVFRLDAKNYTGLVFAGLVALKLSEYDEARRYYKTAISSQPDGPLAWRGFADYYDHRRPVIKDDQLDAIETYTKLLQFIESDVTKTRSTLSKLIPLHKEFNQEDLTVQCYDRLITTYGGDLSDSDASEVSRVSLEFVTYVVNRTELSKTHWDKVQSRFCVIEESKAKQELRSKVVKKAYSIYLEGMVYKEELHMFLVEECSKLLDCDHHASLPILLHLTLIQLLPSSLQELTERKLVLSESQRSWTGLVSHYQQAGTEVTGHLVSLGWAGQALVGVASEKWAEALDCIRECVRGSMAASECWCLSSLLHLFHRDYQTAEKSATNGLVSLTKCAKFMSARLENTLKICQCQAYIGKGSAKQLGELLPFLSKLHQEGLGQHVTAVLVRAHLLLDNIPSAEQVIEAYKTSKDGDVVSIFGLETEIAAAKKDFTVALEKVSEGLEQKPVSPWLNFLKAKVMWEFPGMEKALIYSALLKAAKADSSNPDIFHYLGDYHRVVSGDLKRAEKCYMKTLSLQPSHCEAAIGLGDILWNNGEQDRAFQIYKDISAVALPQRIKKARLRIGLHQKDKGQYDEAIKSFQTVLSTFPDDKQCWDSLGEAYLARGSFNSALRTFTMCAQLDPDSLHCKYRVARVKQTIGLVQEAVDEFSTILERDSFYFPALLGRGECYLSLALSSLQQNFDGRGLDYVSNSLADLSLAARLHPEFLCIWKMLGDSCVCVHPVSPRVCSMAVPSVLCGGKKEEESSEKVRVGKVDLLRIGCRCYEKALQIDKDAAHFWHDLAQAYFHLSRCFSAGETDRQRALDTALRAAEKAADLKPNEFTYWNTLGVIAASEGIDSPGLAQHSFIRSLQEQEGALAWSNLGALYLKHDNAELAYEAFKKAQAYSPECVQAWTGHGLIAERIGNAESMDLFRHATELGYHPEASMGYGYWVCQTLKTVSLNHLTECGGVELREEAHRGVVRARDNLEKVDLRSSRDPCALNYLGLLCEQEGLGGKAEKVLTRALECCSSRTEQETVGANLARVQSCLGKGSTAVSCLEAISGTLNDLYLELALAYFRINNRGKSRQAYEVYMSSGSEETEANRSVVLTAQAMGAFANQDRESCKLFLFEAFKAAPVSLHGLISLCALACILKDSRLLEATLVELSNTLDWQVEEVRILHPSCLQALRVMNYLLMDASSEISSSDSNIVTQLLQKIPEHVHSNLLPPTPLCLHIMLEGDTPLLSSAQKMVHSYPDNVWALGALASRVEDVRIKDGYNAVVLDLVKSQLKSNFLPNTAPTLPWKSSILKSLVGLYSSLGGDLSFMVS